MKEIIEYHLKGEGYDSITDFLQSCFHILQWKPLLSFSMSFGTIAYFFERYIGLEPIVYLAFVSLLALELITGVRVSVVKKKEKFTSKRFGRFFIKIMAYTILIGIINIFKERLPTPEILGLKVEIYTWIYYTGLTWINSQLILSVFENFGKLGWSEAKGFHGFMLRKFNKYFDLKLDDSADKKRTD